MVQVREQPREHLVAVRETVESIWIAIVLAFVLRAFVVEAFVIPTGSMAPRLMGQHWQFDCPACGYHYAYGIPSPPGSTGADLSQPIGTNSPPAACPNCEFRHNFAPTWGFGGDRVLVLKYLYRFREPRPWDVVVFKNPQDNEQNYIKRLIGLPGSMVEIVHGDVFIRQGRDVTGDGVIDENDFFSLSGKSGKELEAILNPPPDDRSGQEKKREFLRAYLNDPRFNEAFPARILTKPAETQNVMWQVIFENDYQPDPEVFRAAGQKWQFPWQGVSGPAGWDEKPSPSETDKLDTEIALLEFPFHPSTERLWDTRESGRRVFCFAGGAGPETLAFVLLDENGRARQRRRFLPVYGYNQPVSDPERNSYYSDSDVSGDLRLSCLFVPRAEDARIGLHLSSFQHHFRAWVSADGQCLLRHGLADSVGNIHWDAKNWGAQALAPLRLGEGCRVALTHVDRQVALWIDGRCVIQGNETLYPADYRQIVQQATGRVPTPVAAFLGLAGPSELRHVELSRDVYYTSPCILNTTVPGQGTFGNPIVLRQYDQNRDMDEFFVLGDNSPASLDSRLWSSPSPTLRPGYRIGTVPRYGMIGKAFFVYWPGGFRVPLTLPGAGQLPIVPNVGRMRLIR